MTSKERAYDAVVTLERAERTGCCVGFSEMIESR
jgi:hypothetical protein